MIVNGKEWITSRIAHHTWRETARYANGLEWRRNDGMKIILSLETKDGHDWIHVSCSFPTQLPRWKDLQQIKDAIIGREAQAVQVLAPASEHVNYHEYCLHLYARLDGSRVVPDFRDAIGLV